MAKQNISPASRTASKDAPHIAYSAADVAKLITEYNQANDYKGTVAGFCEFADGKTKGNEFPLTKAWLSDPKNLQRLKLKLNALRKTLKAKTTEDEWSQVNRNLTFPRAGRSGRSSTVEQARDVLDFMGIGNK